MTDPLAQFRRKPISPAAQPPPLPREPDGYVAFNAKDRLDRLIIRRANAPGRSPGYGYLLDIAFDGPYGTNFVLYYSFMMMVIVEGRNLQTVITALQMGTVEYIQEYDADLWPKPKDDKAPFIESIKVIMQQGGPTLPENDKSGKPSGSNLH